MKFDIIVVGAGHAGIEAAHIAAKRSLSVLLLTSHLDLMGQMSCNPSIGGIAKGNIVREVDALGGLMGRLIDRAGIHFRLLNSSKGSAVWGNRAQADKVQYRNETRAALEAQPSLCILQGMVKRIQVNGECISGVVVDSGEVFQCNAIILAMGTFLNGLAHVGLSSHPAGRSGEPPSTELTENIESLGIQSGRLKTGTSPRIDGRSVDYEKLERQPGDENPWPFSFSSEIVPQNKTVCWVGRTTEETHKIIKESLDRSPLYTGKIKSIGPRYCPSIEDKVVRFGERDGHTLFLEPESVFHQELYLNGLSTSLPYDVQEKMVHSVAGLENARIIRPGYGIEYDYFQPLQLLPTLESRIVRNLYFAGQINGTSGYEEAACQGLIAGINAVQRIIGEEEIILGRETSYAGVLIDDLVTRGTEEPYRMFTSRAEYRLQLRQDNCDERLMPIAAKLGLIEKELFEKRQRLWDRKMGFRNELEQLKVDPCRWNNSSDEKIQQPTRAADLIRRPQVSLQQVITCTGIGIEENRELRVGIESDIKYEGFVAKQAAHIEKAKRFEQAVIPTNFDYDSVRGLRIESRVKLKKIMPKSLGQASRIPGVTPADISILAIYVSKVHHTHVSRETMGSDV